MKQIRVSVAVLAVASSFVTLLLYWMHLSRYYPWSNYADPSSITGQNSQPDGVYIDVEHDLMMKESRKLFMEKIERERQQQIDSSSNADESLKTYAVNGAVKYDLMMKETRKPFEEYEEAERQERLDIEIAEHFLNTPGCHIPKMPMNFTKYFHQYRNTRSCQKRAVFMKRIDKEDTIQVKIKSTNMKTYLRKTANFNCCYQYIATEKKNQSRINKCERIEDGDKIILKKDFIEVKCFESEKYTGKNPIYQDFYAFTKFNNRVKNLTSRGTKKYNVLLLGMDSMSVERIMQTMPETYVFLKQNSFLDFHGFHKIADNTFPNLMATLTGRNLSTIVNRCSRNIDKCQDMFVWDIFKKSGYVTAYGEDYIRLPDTFNKDFKFKKPPTDHYMRPFFLRGERETIDKSLVCTGKISSGQHILDYARDFTQTYRYHNFFGVFWINSCSHNVNSYPQDADQMFVSFLKYITYSSGVMDNTFLIVFSDHGIRFGDHRFSMESYYDDRLPMFFLGVPTYFKKHFPSELLSIINNQLHLVTPYDLHRTLVNIHQISTNSENTEPDYVESCPKCQSLFYETSFRRTCQDVMINDKWCACHKMLPLDTQDLNAQQMLRFLVLKIKNLLSNIQTRRCWKCVDKNMIKFLRVHYYYKGVGTELFFVLAFTMSPGNTTYEATVKMKDGDNFEVLEPISAISPYKGLGKCSIKVKDRIFCMCQKVQDCH